MSRRLKQEEGWIAFLDLLGTKQAIMASDNQEGTDNYASFFDSICVSGTAYHLRGAPLVPMSVRDWTKLHVEPHAHHYLSRTSAFSDSFIIASPELDEDFFKHIISIIQSAWEHGLAIRGALAHGFYLADSDGRPLRGAPIVAAAQWEGAQDWAWISVCPESLERVAGESSFLREAEVPSKRGRVKTYALRPRLSDDAEDEAGTGLDAEKLADITYKAWLSARDSGLEDVCLKCRNTLHWLEQDDVAPAFLNRQDSEQLQLSFVEEEYKIRIRLNGDESNAIREPFINRIEALQQQLECLEVQWDTDYKWCVLRVRYAGSPSRRHLLQRAVSLSFHGSDIALRCDIAPAEIDLFKRDEENASDPVKTLVPPGNLSTVFMSKMEKTTASMTARFSLATRLIPATPSKTVIYLMVECIAEGDFKTAAALAEELDTRVPPHVWPLARAVLNTNSFKEIVSLKFVPTQSGAEWWSDGHYWYNRSILLRELGQFERGIESAALAVALQPSNADAWDEIGEFYSTMNKPGLAIRWHQQALLLSPASCKYRNHLGISLMALGRLDEAEQTLIEAIQLDPNYWYARMTLAWVYVKRGDGAAALRCVAGARAAGAGEYELLPAEAIASWVAGDYKRTLQTLKRLPEYKYGLAEQQDLELLEIHCLIEEGRAEEVLRKVEGMAEPQDAPDATLLLYAQALISLGRSTDARNLLQGREMKGNYEKEAEFVAELARREAGTYDLPLTEPVERPLRPASRTLCLSTIRRAAQYAIL